MTFAPGGPIGLELEPISSDNDDTSTSSSTNSTTVPPKGASCRVARQLHHILQLSHNPRRYWVQPSDCIVAVNGSSSLEQPLYYAQTIALLQDTTVERTITFERPVPPQTPTQTPSPTTTTTTRLLEPVHSLQQQQQQHSSKPTVDTAAASTTTKTTTTTMGQLQQLSLAICKRLPWKRHHCSTRKRLANRSRPKIQL